MSARLDVRGDYRAFLRAKTTPGVRYEGHYAILPEWDAAEQDVASELRNLAPHLHEYQRFAVTFAVARKRAALFLECGLGKTSIALAWAEHMRQGGPALVCAPLAALHEFERERDKFFPATDLRVLPTANVDAWIERPTGIALVTHHAFVRDRDLSDIAAVVLDESSILKSGTGAIAQSLSRSVRPVHARLALSATPAPNDPTEYAAHAVWLGYMRSDAEFRARFFVRDGRDWRVKGHADVLSYHAARTENDEKHICPLQLTVIERCVRLWSNPGETVFTPFAGIGSEVYTAIRQRRFGLGVELKREYFEQAVRNAERAVAETHLQGSLFESAGAA